MSTEKRTFAASDASLSSTAWDDLGRYLDATRSELVFARRVILVEGFAEQVLLPRVGAPSLDFDEHGLTVCVIHGTHFLSYVRFLRAIGTPYAVVTDGDPDAGSGRTGADRIERLLNKLDAGSDAEELGIFCGERTFESDLFDASEANRAAMYSALLSFRRAGRVRDEILAAQSDDSLDGENFFPYVERVSKGRFAQRLASHSEHLDAPPYIYRALTHVMS